MSSLKNSPTNNNVDAFLASIESASQRADALILKDLMEEITGCKAAMWGPSMVGFDSYHYQYESGREGDWFVTGFSPRKQALSIYILAGFEKYDELLSGLGKYKTGKGCLYVKKLEDIDVNVLKILIARSSAFVKAK